MTAKEIKVRVSSGDSMQQAKQSQGGAPRAPLKGSFPLDHFGDCHEQVQAYQDCLKKHDNESYLCRELSRAYLQCRMDTYALNEFIIAKL